MLALPDRVVEIELTRLVACGTRRTAGGRWSGARCGLLFHTLLPALLALVAAEELRAVRPEASARNIFVAGTHVFPRILRS